MTKLNHNILKINKKYFYGLSLIVLMMEMNIKNKMNLWGLNKINSKYKAIKIK